VKFIPILNKIRCKNISIMNYISKQHFLVLFIFSFYGLGSANSQEDSNNKDVLGLKRNAIYGSVGIDVMYFTASAYYERIIGKGIESINAEVFFDLEQAILKHSLSVWDFVSEIFLYV